jgi:hypothetical protein
VLELPDDVTDEGRDEHVVQVHVLVRQDVPGEILMAQMGEETPRQFFYTSRSLQIAVQKAGMLDCFPNM